MSLLVRPLKKPGSLVSPLESEQVVSGYVVLESGKEVGEHETGGGEELITFLEGVAEVRYEGKTCTINSPAVVLIPAHAQHNVRNRSKKLLKYVYAYVMAMDSS
jgi:quercetin dioxygenase-like cupin family protein